MQPDYHERLNHQLTALTFAYEQISKAYFNYCDAEAKWTPELGAYLRDEADLGPKTKAEIRHLANRMCHMRAEISELRANVGQLCFELQRVGSGE